MNIVDTFIQVAPDCPVGEAVVPVTRGDKQIIACIEYELLSKKPYTYSLEELQFAVHARHKAIDPAELRARRQEMWLEFFARPHACMRASPLPKKYGWGVHYDGAGKLAIYPVESKEYRRLAADKKLEHFFAMRSSRD